MPRTEKIVRVIYNGDVTGTAMITPDGHIDIQMSGGPTSHREFFEAVGERDTEGLVLALLPVNVMYRNR